jgi:hypothetical protein
MNKKPFLLNFEQFSAMCRADSDFMDSALSLAFHCADSLGNFGLNPIEFQVRKIVSRAFLDNGAAWKIPAIKALREWSEGKKELFEKYGLGYEGRGLGLADSKNLVEREHYRLTKE